MFYQSKNLEFIATLHKENLFFVDILKLQQVLYTKQR